MTTKQGPQAVTSRQKESQAPEAVTGGRAIKVGVLGSLAGTMAMDLVMVAESLLLGQPVDGFLAVIGSVLAGGMLVGVVIHLVTGSLLGLLFGAAVYKVDLLTIDTLRKGVWLGVLAVLVTIPFGCVPFAVATVVVRSSRWSGSRPSHTWSGVPFSG